MDLSQNLVKHILGYIRHDQKTLWACTLVCHTWHGAAQEHLFRQVIITTPRAFNRLLLAASSNQTLRYAIQSLSIVETCRKIQDWERSPKIVILDKSRLWVPPYLACLGDHFSNLQVLRVDHLYSLRSTGTQWPSLPILQRLEIIDCTMCTPGELMELVLPFPKLSELKIHDTTWGGSFPSTTAKNSVYKVTMKSLFWLDISNRDSH